MLYLPHTPPLCYIMSRETHRFTHGFEDDQTRFAEISRLQEAVKLQFNRLLLTATHSGLVGPRSDLTVAGITIEDHVTSDAAALAIFSASFARLIVLRNSRSISTSMSAEKTCEMQAAYLVAFKTLEVMAGNYVVDLVERANFDFFLGKDKLDPAVDYNSEIQKELQVERYRKMRSAGIDYVGSITNLFAIFAYLLCHAEAFYGTPEPFTRYDQWHHFVLSPDGILTNQCKLVMLYSWQLHGFFESPYATSNYYQCNFPQKFMAFAQNAMFHIIGKLLMRNTPSEIYGSRIYYRVADLLVRPNYAEEYEIMMLKKPVVLVRPGARIGQQAAFEYAVPDLASATFALTSPASNAMAMGLSKQVYVPTNPSNLPYISVYSPDKSYVVDSRMAFYKYYATPEGRRVFEAHPPTEDPVQILIPEIAHLIQSLFVDTIDIALFGAVDGDPQRHIFTWSAASRAPLVRNLLALQRPVVVPRQFRRLSSLTKFNNLYNPKSLRYQYEYAANAASSFPGSDTRVQLASSLAERVVVTEQPPFSPVDRRYYQNGAETYDATTSSTSFLSSPSSSSSALPFQQPDEDDYRYYPDTANEPSQTYAEYGTEYDSLQPPRYSPSTPSPYHLSAPTASQVSLGENGWGWVELLPRGFDDDGSNREYYIAVPSAANGDYDEDAFVRELFSGTGSYAESTQGDIDANDSDRLFGNAVNW